MSYITFSSLGSAADLGSQIQQYCSMYAVAKETGKKIVFSESALRSGWTIKFINLIDVEYEIKHDDFFSDFVNIAPTDGLLMDHRVFELDAEKNYNFTNLFHLHHYWYSKYGKDVFNFSWNIKYSDAANNLINSIKPQNKELVSIHVRRGDYLKHDHFCKLDNEYYSKAIEGFLPEIEKYHFLVFSNDIEWCKANLIEGEMVTFMHQGLDYVDMIAMSLCDHNIIANSNFSWWAAFRNRNPHKKVICPKNYIRSYSPFSFLNGNWYPENWTFIENEVK